MPKIQERTGVAATRLKAHFYPKKILRVFNKRNVSLRKILCLRRTRKLSFLGSAWAEWLRTRPCRVSYFADTGAALPSSAFPAATEERRERGVSRLNWRIL